MNPAAAFRIDDQTTSVIVLPAEISVLRERFVRLMDRAVHLVQERGLDQDDFVLERWGRLQPVDGPVPLEVPIEWLADPTMLLNLFYERYLEVSEAVDRRRPVTVLGLWLLARRVPEYPPSTAGASME